MAQTAEDVQKFANGIITQEEERYVSIVNSTCPGSERVILSVSRAGTTGKNQARVTMTYAEAIELANLILQEAKLATRS